MILHSYPEIFAAMVPSDRPHALRAPEQHCARIFSSGTPSLIRWRCASFCSDCRLAWFGTQMAPNRYFSPTIGRTTSLSA